MNSVAIAALVALVGDAPIVQTCQSAPEDLTAGGWIGLDEANRRKAARKAKTSGSVPCQCGRTISANKASCLACSKVAA